MKGFLLLAAIHVLIIYQAQKSKTTRNHNISKKAALAAKQQESNQNLIFTAKDLVSPKKDFGNYYFSFLYSSQAR